MTLRRRIVPHPFDLAALCLLAVLPTFARAGEKAAKPKIEGLWDAPGGQVSLTSEKGHVLGVMKAPAAGVDLKNGQKVLDGTLDEDNLTADVRLGVVVPGCGATDGTAFAVLLLTRSGKLTGGASAKATCASNLSSVTMTRAKAPEPGVEAPRPTAPVQAPLTEQYDPRGRRQVPYLTSVKELLTDGGQYLNEGQFEKARAQFLKALGGDPNVGETYNGIGATYYGRNDYETAIDWYKRGLEAAPGFGDLYYNLACAYAQQNKPTLALRFLKLAANKGYAEVSALDSDPDLEPIRKDPQFLLIRSAMLPGGGSPPAVPPPAPALAPAPAAAAPAPATAPSPGTAIAPDAAPGPGPVPPPARTSSPDNAPPGGTEAKATASMSPDAAPRAGIAGPAPRSTSPDAAPGAGAATNPTTP